MVNLAKLCREANLDGVVCSAQEAAILKQEFGNKLLLVTPGIRLPEDDSGDQKRVLTPAAAVEKGADYLVIGRSITQANAPQKVIERIEAELK